MNELLTSAIQYSFKILLQESIYFKNKFLVPQN